MKTVDDFRDGMRQLSAADLNALLAEMRAISAMVVDGGEIDRSRSGYLLRVNPHNPNIWAKITGEAAEPNQGRYSWEELTLQDDGTFVTKTAGHSGTTTQNWAKDIAAKVGVPVGLPVLMMPGIAKPNATTPTEIDQGWRFLTPDLVQLVREKDGPANDSGDVDAVVMRWSAAAGAYVESESIWLKKS